MAENFPQMYTSFIDIEHQKMEELMSIYFTTLFEIRRKRKFKT